MINKEKNILTYDSIAEVYDRSFPGPSERIDELSVLIAQKSTILDIGCGAGNNAVFLANMGHNVIGIDLSDSMLALAKNKKSPAKFIKMDMCNMVFDESCFDCVIASYALCHVRKSEIAGWFAKIRSFLRPDGILFIELHVGDSCEVTVTEPLDNTLTTDMNIMSRAEIMEYLEKNQFKVLKLFAQPEQEFGLNDIQDVCVIAKKL